MINILGGGLQRDIFSKLTRQIFPVDMAQRDIIGGVLRLLFSAEVSSEVSSVNWPDKSFL